MSLLSIMLISLSLGLNSAPTLLGEDSLEPSQIVETEESQGDNDAMLTTTYGLLAVGGAGSVVVAINNKNKKENTPIKTKDEEGYSIDQ